MNVNFHEQLDRELSASPAPPLGDLVADAVTTGTRARRRQRLAILGSGAAALVITATAGVLAFGNLGGGNPGDGNTATTSNLITAGDQPTATASATPPTSGAAVVALLKELVAPGLSVTEIDSGEDGGQAFGSFVYNDGAGAATVSAMVSATPADYGPTVTGLGCPPNGDGFVCEHSTTPDGYEVRILTMGPYTVDCEETKCDLKDVRVEIKRPDGRYITVEAYSGKFGHGRGATRPDTILSAAELTALAKDARWP